MQKKSPTDSQKTLLKKRQRGYWAIAHQLTLVFLAWIEGILRMSDYG